MRGKRYVCQSRMPYLSERGDGCRDSEIADEGALNADFAKYQRRRENSATEDYRRPRLLALLASHRSHSSRTP